jgi:membrane protease YdiL (CAAX protease family)
METSPARPAPASDGTATYFALACGITWLLAAPAAEAWMRHQTPPPHAVAAAGLSAFGPLLAALAVAGPRRQLRQVFGRWRTNPIWIVVGLLATPAVHLLATALYAAIGGRPARWFHPPATPEAMAALVVFPLGEEFGWRGFAHPRLVRRFGAVRGCLILGAGWGLWHLAYSVTPQAAGFDPFGFALMLIELPLYSLIIGWVFERANRSMAVAIALHAGAHIDHIEWAPRTELGLHVAHVVVLAAVAALAARSLARREHGHAR